MAGAAGGDELASDAGEQEHYEELRATLEKRGTPIGAIGLMMAAHVRSRGRS
jgi:predicted nucleic acid-binding protein